MSNLSKVIHLSKEEKAELINDIHSAYKLYRISNNKKPYDLYTPNDKNSAYYSSLKEAISETIGRVDVREATLHLFFHDKEKVNYKIKTISAIQDFINSLIENTSFEENLNSNENSDLFSRKSDEELFPKYIQDILYQIRSLKLIGKYYEAESLYQKTLEQLDSECKWSQKTVFLVEYSYKQLLSEKLPTLEIAMTAAKLSNNDTLISAVRSELAKYYSRIGDSKIALELLDKNLELGILINSNLILGRTYKLKLLTYYTNGAYDTFFNFANEAISFFREILLDKSYSDRGLMYRELAEIYTYILNINQSLNSGEEILANAKKMLKYSKRSNNEVLYAEALRRLAKIEKSKQGRWKKYLRLAKDIYVSSEKFLDALDCIGEYTINLRSEENSSKCYSFFVFETDKLISSITNHDIKMEFVKKMSMFLLREGDFIDSQRLLSKYFWDTNLDIYRIRLVIDVVKILDKFNIAFDSNKMIDYALSMINNKINSKIYDKDLAEYFYSKGEINFYLYKAHFYENFLSSASIYLKENDYRNLLKVMTSLIDKDIYLGNYSEALVYCNQVLEYKIEFENLTYKEDVYNRIQIIYSKNFQPLLTKHYYSKKDIMNRKSYYSIKDRIIENAGIRTKPNSDTLRSILHFKTSIYNNLKHVSDINSYIKDWYDEYNPYLLSKYSTFIGIKGLLVLDKITPINNILHSFKNLMDCWALHLRDSNGSPKYPEGRSGVNFVNFASNLKHIKNFFKESQTSIDDVILDYSKSHKLDSNNILNKYYSNISKYNYLKNDAMPIIIGLVQDEHDIIYSELLFSYSNRFIPIFISFKNAGFRKYYIKSECKFNISFTSLEEKQKIRLIKKYFNLLVDKNIDEKDKVLNEMFLDLNDHDAIKGKALSFHLLIIEFEYLGNIVNHPVIYLRSSSYISSGDSPKLF